MTSRDEYDANVRRLNEQRAHKEGKAQSLLDQLAETNRTGGLAFMTAMGKAPAPTENTPQNGDNR
ncbi:hypothetical protein [Microbacterium indicum]|uniref:hypothetical protein n=1 Tax=Microbacterium indicum TaxID=358100 RepID=UPI0004216CD5|nr:hypothetical protein [Microbacterium indicum]